MAYSNIVVGIFFAGATLVSLLATSAALPTLYWALGLPAGLALIVLYEMRRERAIGAIYRDVLMAGAAFALTAIAIATIAVDPPDGWAWTQGAMAALLIAAGIVGRSWERP